MLSQEKHPKIERAQNFAFGQIAVALGLVVVGGAMFISGNLPGGVLVIAGGLVTIRSGENMYKAGSIERGSYTKPRGLRRLLRP